MKVIDQINESGLFAQSAYSAGIATNDGLGREIASTYLTGIPAGTMNESSFEYDSDNKISGYNGSAFAGQGGIVGLPITGTEGVDSASYGIHNLEFTRYETEGEPDIRTAVVSPDFIEIRSTFNNVDYNSVFISDNGISLTDPTTSVDMGLYELVKWNSTWETVENNSASWGQGGIDSATCSAIASSYAESAVSGVTETVANNSATWGQGGGGIEYSGIAPIVVNNTSHEISADASYIMFGNGISAYENTATNTTTLSVTGQVVTATGGNTNYTNQINGKGLSATIAYKAKLDEGNHSILALWSTVNTNSATWSQATPITSIPVVGDSGIQIVNNNGTATLGISANYILGSDVNTVVVTASLPGTPDTGTLYLIPEA